jgi:hypothetical protein
MYRDELMKFEGVWSGTERVTAESGNFEATARLVFTTVFDARFLLCDYVQTAPDRPTTVAHGVFRRDEQTNALTVTWFRSPAATPSQQSDGVADGDKLIFLETIDGRTTRTTYATSMDKLSVRTECAQPDGEWTMLLDGTYRRR